MTKTEPSPEIVGRAREPLAKAIAEIFAKRPWISMAKDVNDLRLILNSHGMIPPASTDELTIEGAFAAADHILGAVPELIAVADRLSALTEAAEANLDQWQAVNTVLGNLLAPLIPDLVERIEKGNAACTDILAALNLAAEASEPVAGGAIKPCPFCGCAGEISVHPNTVFVTCTNCWAVEGRRFNRDQEVQAIAAWNTRPANEAAVVASDAPEAWERVGFLEEELKQAANERDMWKERAMSLRLKQPNEAERIAALEEARQQGQREGKSAVCQWLRERAAMKPPASLWCAAETLADQFEQSEIPCSTLKEPRP